MKASKSNQIVEMLYKKDTLAKRKQLEMDYQKGK